MGSADKRILSARRWLRGPRDALDNIIGLQLDEGTQCYVIEEQANYRFTSTCSLPVDGRFVVRPNGGNGKWVRESGLSGFALLERGTVQVDPGICDIAMFGEFKEQQVVQFEQVKGAVRYIGSVPRVALIFGSAELAFDRGSAELYVSVDSQGVAIAQAHLATAGSMAVSTMAMLMPGDSISLRARSKEHASGTGSLRAVLL